MFLLFLVVCGVVALVIVKVVRPNKKAIQDAAAAVGLPTWNATQLTEQVQHIYSNITSRAASVDVMKRRATSGWVMTIG